MQSPSNPWTTRDRQLIEGVIANLPLFWGVAPAGLAAVARRSWTLPVARGMTIIERAGRLPGIFALAYGSVKLVLRGRDGAQRVLRLVAAQQTFGESSALLGRGSPYDAVALQDSKLVMIATASLFALVDRDARFGRGLVTLLAERTAELYAEMEAATLLSGTQRLASYLKQLAGADGARTVSLPFSKTLVAARLGIKKETLSRLLRDFVERRVIDVARREIAILEPAQLGALAGAGSDEGHAEAKLP